MLTLVCLCIATTGAPAHWETRATDEGEVRLARDHEAIRPLVGLGPLLAHDGRTLRPGEYPVRILRRDQAQDSVTLRLAADLPVGSLEYEIAIAWEPGAARIAVRSDSPLVRGLAAGALTDAGPWQRYDLSRLQEAYGQHWWPRTNYLARHDLFLSAGWQLEGSHGSAWGEVDPAASGDGPLPLAPDVHYLARSDGSYAPLSEVLVLRYGDRLVDAMPLPTQAPSPYREELARSVFVDLWGGTARECAHLLEVLGHATRGEQPLITVLQPWECAGWDALLPDSVRMPDYPPDPGVGSVEELRLLCDRGRSLGRFAFRTNYLLARDVSPSLREGLAHRARALDGSASWHTKPTEWAGLAARQEGEIRDLFGPSAGFTDQLTSGAWPGSWLDFDASAGPLAGTLGETLRAQQEFARTIRTAHDGPLGSESLMDQHLLGAFVDYGDFGIMDGLHRAPCPEYHLRVMRNWTAFHGMGLVYRFVENAPYPEFHAGRCRFWQDRAQQDDYRCMAVLYGNGGYLYWDPGVPWSWILTEVLLVGRLQQQYAAVPVVGVEYLEGARWKSLEQLIREGRTYPIAPGVEPPAWLRRTRVTYGNGLRVVANRAEEALEVEAHGRTITLPRSGWVAWQPDSSFLASSALDPATGTRIDWLEDADAGVQYIDPRGVASHGVTAPTLFRNGEPWLRLDEAAGMLRCAAGDLALSLPEPAPLTRLDFEFGSGLAGWRPMAGLLRMEARDGVLRLHTVTEDPQLLSPPLRIDAASAPTVVLRIRASTGEMGQLYWATEAAPGWSEERCARFPLHPGAEFEEIRIALGDHPGWNGQTITRIRLDPVHGPPEADLEIGSIAAER